MLILTGNNEFISLKIQPSAAIKAVKGLFIVFAFVKKLFNGIVII